MKDENRIENLMISAMQNMRSLIDVDVIVGNPIISQNNMTILPLTKVTMGFVSGGGEYFSELKEIKKDREYPFAGGLGTGVNLQPIAFLVLNGNSYNLVKIEEKTALEKLIEVAPEISKFISKICKSGSKNEK